MRDYWICLNSLDLGQALDGLRMREESWRNTAEFFRTGVPPHEFFLAEECNGEEEAASIADHYKKIIATISRQRDKQDEHASQDETMPPAAEDGSRPMFCIYVDTFFQGPIPTERNEQDGPVVYPTRRAAEREIADFLILRLYQFLAGERELEDACFIDEYVVPVDLLPDGSIVDEEGRHFSAGSW